MASRSRHPTWDSACALQGLQSSRTSVAEKQPVDHFKVTQWHCCALSSIWPLLAPCLHSHASKQPPGFFLPKFCNLPKPLEVRILYLYIKNHISPAASCTAYSRPSKPIPPHPRPSTALEGGGHPFPPPCFLGEGGWGSTVSWEGHEGTGGLVSNTHNKHEKNWLNWLKLIISNRYLT